MISKTIIAKPKRLLRYAFALVWLANGLLCKVLHLVPRHQQIVARIMSEEHAGLLTTTIGILEIAMAGWILSGGIKPRLCAVTQMVVVGAMNGLEFFLAPDLLLFGRLNLLFASCFILLIFFNEFAGRRTE